MKARHCGHSHRLGGPMGGRAGHRGLLFTGSLASCWGQGEPFSAEAVTLPCISVALS